MPALFFLPKRKTFYHHHVIPLSVRQHFAGLLQFWRSLRTNDKDTATVRSVAWNARFLRLFTMLKKDGPRMTREHYMVTSEITGNDCWGIGIKICDTVKVVAFKKSGEFYEMPTSFSTVSTYSEDKGRCSINIDAGVWTPLRRLQPRRCQVSTQRRTAN